MTLRSLSVVILVTALASLSSFASAGPIGLPKSADFLSADDLQVLAERHDRGLHLGWFNPKDRSSGPETVDLTDPIFADSSAGSAGLLGDIPTLLPLGPTSVFPGVNPVTPASLNAIEPNVALATVPEPSSLLLMGAGGVALFARLRRRGKQA